MGSVPAVWKRNNVSNVVCKQNSNRLFSLLRYKVGYFEHMQITTSHTVLRRACSKLRCQVKNHSKIRYHTQV